jgi:cytochrome c553
VRSTASGTKNSLRASNFNRAPLSGRGFLFSPSARDEPHAYILSTLVFAAAFAFSPVVLAAEGDVAAGKAKAEATGCVACHGANGISTGEGIPDLAAQPDLFVQFQLVFFRSGARQSETMNPIAKDLSDEEIRNLGAYFASLPPPDSPATPDQSPDQTKLGESIANAVRGASCHGDSLQGQDNVARLAGERQDYLVKALHDFKSGARTGTSLNVMVEVARPFSDQQIQALAHYLSRLH